MIGSIRGSASPTAVRRMATAYRVWQSETAKIKIRKTNLECPLESTRQKTRCGRRRLDPNSEARPVDLTRALPTGYLVTHPARRSWLACIILQARGLSFKNGGIRGKPSGNEASTCFEIGDLTEKAPKNQGKASHACPGPLRGSDSGHSSRLVI